MESNEKEIHFMIHKKSLVSKISIALKLLHLKTCTKKNKAPANFFFIFEPVVRKDRFDSCRRQICVSCGTAKQVVRIRRVVLRALSFPAAPECTKF